MQQTPFGRIKKPLKSDMNVVPYIDVMLVLLVIFMITAPMITTGLTVDLPKADANPLTTSGQQLAIVSVKANQQYFVRFGSGADTPLPVEKIKEVLETEQTISKQNGSTLMVLVNGDSSVPYGDIVAMMSHLQQAGILRVGLLTEQSSTAAPVNPTNLVDIASTANTVNTVGTPTGPTQQP